LEAWARRHGATVIWVDESGFYLLPGLVRTYAPRGQTPILALPLTRDHLAAISGITRAGRLFLTVQERAVNGADAATFLRRVLRLVRGPLLVIWDGAPIHRAAPIKRLLASTVGRRLRLETLPGYAPELNPDEGIWQYLKHVELRNLCCDDLPRLRDELGRAARRLRHRPDIIRACFREVGLSA
jgi:transposase